MLFHKLLVTLFAVPFVVAQDAQPSASDAAAAPSDGAAPAAETPAADPAAGSAAPAAATTHKGSVGGNTENTGHGVQNSTAGDWKVTNFTAPNTEIYWVNEAENTAMWGPYDQAVDLVIFNSNTSLLAEQRQVASNIPAGTGSWTGMISGFLPGNNYILVLALTADPTRKIAQTRGFWIKRNGTLAAPLPSGAGQTLSGGGVAATGSETPTAPAASSPAGTGPAAAATSGSGAKMAASFVAVIGAGALAFTLF